MSKKRLKILIVDDEAGIRGLLADILADEGYATCVAESAESAWTARLEERPDLILLDIWMPDTDGITLLRQWLEAGFAKVPIIVMSGHATIDSAVEAVQLGAAKVMEKPVATEPLLAAVAAALATKRETDVNPALQRANFGASPPLKKLREDLLAAAADPLPLTMQGGANSAAVFFAAFLALPKMRVLHIDSGALLEGDVDGFFKRAEGALAIFRLFDMLTPMRQSGLLGVLREAGKRGGRIVVCVDEAPEKLAEKHNFNPMLAAILRRRVVEVPPLENYKSDIPALVNLLAERITEGTDMAGRKFSPAAVEALTAGEYEHDFAELASLVKSALLYARGDTVEAAMVRALAERAGGGAAAAAMRDEMYTLPYRQARDMFEREYFLRLVGVTNGNIPQAAKMAELERTYFYRKLKQYNKEQADL